MTRQIFVQQKSELYDYINHKLADMNATNSNKLDLLSNFMMESQDQIKELQNSKGGMGGGSGDFNHKELSNHMQQRDKMVRDSVYTNS